jgi:hypothetical protein
MILRQVWPLWLFIALAAASYGDRLPEFQRCVEVCKTENCQGNHQTTIRMISSPLQKQF